MPCVKFNHENQNLKNMKTITKFLLALACVCLLIACSKSDDDLGTGNQQLKSAETKTVVWKDVDYGYWSPVYCDGIEVDVLTGIIKANIVAHYEKGDLKWYMFKWEGEVMSDKNQEIFVVHESDKVSIPIPGTYTYHLNLVGNMGSHYINSGTLNMADWTITINKSVCPGYEP